MKSKSLFVLLTVLMLSLMLMVSACDSSDPTPDPTPAPSENGNGDEGNGANDPAPTGDNLELGAVLPLTGSNAATGLNLQAAMEVAEDIINNAHDIPWDIAQNAGLAGLGGAKVTVTYADCQSDATIAATEAANLLDAGISGIAGAYASGYSASVGAQALEYGVPMICGSSSSASLTDGVTYDFGSVFNRIAASDEMETIEFYNFLDYLNDEYDAGIETVAIAYINNAYGIHADEMFELYANQYGYTIVAQVAYEADITAADTEAAQIIAANPDVVFQASYIGDLTMFAQAYNSYGFEPTMIICYCGGFQDASFGQVATSLGADFYAGGQACTVELADKMEVFSYINDLYKAKTGLDIDGPALEEFASIIVLAQAASIAGSYDPGAINTTIRSTSFDAPYLTIGSITFNENGQNTDMAAFITQLIEGKYQVVFPRDEYVTADPLI